MNAFQVFLLGSLVVSGLMIVIVGYKLHRVYVRLMEFFDETDQAE
jgi:hypothetical protein